jgi:hypothetical protein
MSCPKRLCLTLPLAGLMVLFANDNPSLTASKSLVTQAQARVGRPLTPLSGAGVARRTTRRAIGYGAVGVGAAAGAAAVGGAVVAPYGGCVRGPYGRVVCR